MRAKALMVGGTASHVGKSWMTTAVCRWLYRRGVKVAPFKAQNMSNNSYPCVEGGEIGRAQVAQAQACGLEPSADMNPILLKPTSNVGSQVVLQGKPWRNLSAAEYYEQHDFLRSKVHQSFNSLADRYEYLVVEGAGSIAELNLRQTDLVNLGLAKHFGIPVLLLADIDRGGVFGSLYGTISLLTQCERDLVRAFAINRFRGDPSLFVNGVQIIEQKTDKPCLGVFPFLADVRLDEEDSVSLEGCEDRQRCSSIAIVRFPHISNHTDFRLLDSAAWIDWPVERQFDSIILPGTKSTVADLCWMRARGLEQWLVAQHRNGARIIGICGGYQMLGASIEDPRHVESQIDRIDGIGLLPVRTTLHPEKVTRAVEGRTPSGTIFSAYEIHVGETIALSKHDGFALVDNLFEGISYQNCFGTYLHGALENPAVVEEYLGVRIEHAQDRNDSFDRLADWFETAADLAQFEKLFLS